MSEREREVRVQRDRCPYCHHDVAATPERTACNACAAWHHQACWTESPGCGACGFERSEPATAFSCDAADCNQHATERVEGSLLCRHHTRRRLRRNALLRLSLALMPIVLGLVAFSETLRFPDYYRWGVPFGLVMVLWGLYLARGAYRLWTGAQAPELTSREDRSGRGITNGLRK